jgi:Na+-transporting methylmalonyl-CoA/oxaloacetate decarboxylase gamma subunit
MYGLAAIQQADGWAMAGAGAGIVLCGLTVLSVLLSMIPRITGAFEKRAAPPEESPPPAEQPKHIVPDKLPADNNAAATIYMALVEDLGQAFTLVELHQKTRALGLPHPHLSINRFRDAGILVSVGDGRFSWQPLSE